MHQQSNFKSKVSPYIVKDDAWVAVTEFAYQSAGLFSVVLCQPSGEIEKNAGLFLSLSLSLSLSLPPSFPFSPFPSFSLPFLPSLPHFLTHSHSLTLCSHSRFSSYFMIYRPLLSISIFAVISSGCLS